MDPPAGPSAPTDPAQAMMQLVSQLAQGKSQLQQALQESLNQQTTISRSIDVRDRSELKGIPKLDKISGTIGAWDSWYFKFKTWIETSHRNAGKCIQEIESHTDQDITDTSFDVDFPDGAELVSAQARQALISLTEGEALRRLIVKYDPQILRQIWLCSRRCCILSSATWISFEKT